MRELTEKEIRARVYAQTNQESSADIECFIRGALWLMNELIEDEKYHYENYPE